MEHYELGRKTAEYMEEGMKRYRWELYGVKGEEALMCEAADNDRTNMEKYDDAVIEAATAGENADTECMLGYISEINDEISEAMERDRDFMDEAHADGWDFCNDMEREERDRAFRTWYLYHVADFYNKNVVSYKTCAEACELNELEEVVAYLHFGPSALSEEEISDLPDFHCNAEYIRTVLHWAQDKTGGGLADLVSGMRVREQR